MKVPVLVSLTVAFAVVLAGCTSPTPDVVTGPTPSATATGTASGEEANNTTMPIVDSGKSDCANGIAVTDTKAVLRGYRVAPDDAASCIVDRFGLESLGQLENSDGEKIGDNIPIIAGETLTLIGNRTRPLVVDGGPQKGAMGETTVAADGRPLSYTVAAGDTPDQICARFDLWWDQLATASGVRLAKYPEIQAGQVLTFTWSKVALQDENDDD